MTRPDVRERALAFGCEGQQLVGVLSEPAAAVDVAVVIIVGGPQYRVGSHRQFVFLARALAAWGAAALRFDTRGMGDSTGPMQSFECSAPEIAGAIDTLLATCSKARRVVLWGLCDAASAALLYWNSTKDARVAGMVLVNPWVRSPVTHARTQLRHYYRERLVQRQFWAKLARFDVDLLGAARSIVRNAATARGPSRMPQPPEFQVRMAEGLRTFEGPVLMLLSGRDLTAQEFRDHAAADPHWRGLLDRANVTRCDFPEADHTFSAARDRADAESRTLQWLNEHLRSQ